MDRPDARRVPVPAARAGEDPGVRVIVVTGTGRGFCVGADAQALEGHVERGSYDSGLDDGTARPGYGVRAEFDADFASQFGIPKPIIAAVNGPAAGVGLVLACYCDLRFAAQGVEIDHLARTTRPAGRVRPLVVAAPSRRRHASRRPAALQPGRAGRGGGAARIGQSGAAARGAAALHLRLRRPARQRDRSLLVGRDQAAALSRPARGRRLVGARRRDAHGRHDPRCRLRRGRRRPDREAPARFPDSPA